MNQELILSLNIYIFNMEENQIFPKSSFYTGTVDIVMTIDDNGKTKKSKETYLIDAKDISDAEAKLIASLGAVNGDWEITNIAKSKITGVCL